MHSFHRTQSRFFIQAIGAAAPRDVDFGPFRKTQTTPYVTQYGSIFFRQSQSVKYVSFLFTVFVRIMKLYGKRSKRQGLFLTECRFLRYNTMMNFYRYYSRKIKKKKKNSKNELSFDFF